MTICRARYYDTRGRRVPGAEIRVVLDPPEQSGTPCHS